MSSQTVVTIPDSRPSGDIVQVFKAKTGLELAAMAIEAGETGDLFWIAEGKYSRRETRFDWVKDFRRLNVSEPQLHAIMAWWIGRSSDDSVVVLTVPSVWDVVGARLLEQILLLPEHGCSEHVIVGAAQLEAVLGHKRAQQALDRVVSRVKHVPRGGAAAFKMLTPSQKMAAAKALALRLDNQTRPNAPHVSSDQLEFIVHFYLANAMHPPAEGTMGEGTEPRSVWWFLVHHVKSQGCGQGRVAELERLVALFRAHPVVKLRGETDEEAQVSHDAHVQRLIERLRSDCARR